MSADILYRCPKCGELPTWMVFQNAKTRRNESYSYICCDLNPGHSDTVEGARASWNHLVAEQRGRKTKTKPAREA